MTTLRLATLAVAAVLATGAAQAQFTERNFRVSNGVSKEHPMGNGLAKMGACTLEKSGGKMKITPYWDGALGNDLTASQSVRTGSLEMVLTSTAPLVGIVGSLLGEAGGAAMGLADRNPLRPDLVGHAMLKGIEAISDRLNTSRSGIGFTPVIISTWPVRIS